MTEQNKTKKLEESTINWLKENWNISVEDNEKNLERVENDELISIWIGCDTGTRSMLDCDKRHGDKYTTQSYSGWTNRCRACDNALSGLPVTMIYVPERERLVEFVDKKEAEKRLKEQEEFEDHEIECKRIEAEERKKKYELEKGNRTVVRVELNTEYGSWRILGGEKGRLEYSVFQQARNEMNQAFNKAMRGHEGQILASRPQPDQDELKFFALLTDNFAYRIDSEVFEE